MVNILKRRSIDATKGPILSQFLLFAIPIAIGGIIQTLFNSADMIVLGNFASSVQVASVGATTVIIGLLVNSCIGLSGGAQVVLSQSFGEGNREKIQKATNTTLWISITLGVLVTILAMSFSEKLLILTKCPEECFADAALYMKIYFASTPAIMIYNYGAAIIRSSGDSQRPLYYLIACGLLNVALNFILCIILPRKVVAVAVATFASQVLGAILVIVNLIRTDSPCKLSLKGFLPDAKTCGRILFLGIPNALNSSLYSISNLQIQSAINSYGPPATAGNSSAANIEGLAFCFNAAFGTTALTFAGQNYGAKKPERIKEVARKGALISAIVGFVLGYSCLLLGPLALKAFLPKDPIAVQYGMVRFKYLMTVFFLQSVNSTLSSILNSFGYSALTMGNSVVTVLGFRVIWMTFVYPKFMTFEGLFLCYTVSWSVSFLVTVLMFAIIYPRNLKKLKRSRDAEEPATAESVAE